MTGQKTDLPLFPRGLRARFEEVVTSRTVWSDVPPATVYYARRPQTRR